MNQTDKIEISIIIPVYNCERYIEKLITDLSVINPSLLEIITINDGSTDNSFSILNKLKKKVSNLIVINQQNKGVSSARNIGIKNAHGTYILFADSDDSINVLKLESLINSLTNDSADLTLFGITDCFINKKETVKIKGVVHQGKILKEEFLKNFSIYLNESIIYSPCNKVYKKEIIQNNNIFFDCSYPLGEDILFNIAYFNKCKNFEFIPEYIYFYNHYFNRKNTGSTKYFDNELVIFEDVLSKINVFLIKNNFFYENEEELYKFHIRRMNSLITSLFSPTCHLNSKEKKDRIISICNSYIFQKALNTKNSSLSPKNKIIRLLYKHRCVQLIYWIFKISY